MDYSIEIKEQKVETTICDISNVNTTNNFSNDHEEVRGVYHRKWLMFTHKLRKIMKENPSLPVVVYSRPSNAYDCIDCDVAYVHDHLTGKLKEKIIMIYWKNDSNPDDFYDNGFDIPFSQD